MLTFGAAVYHAIVGGEPIFAISRRIQAFTIIIPPEFSEFLFQNRPRALVTLAHFFAVVSQVHGVWWLGRRGMSLETTARREIRAINEALPREWRLQMEWPMDAAGLQNE